MHPLFAGFEGASLYAVGQALGFAVHAESCLGALPLQLSGEHQARQLPGEDLAGFHYAGGWEAPAAHCLLFVKPLTAFASACWLAGLGDRLQGARASDFYTGASVLGDLEAAAYAAGGEALAGWPKLTPDASQAFAEAFALLVDGFAVQTGNIPIKSWSPALVASA